MEEGHGASSIWLPRVFEVLWNPAVEEWGGCRALPRQSTEELNADSQVIIPISVCICGGQP